MLVAIPESSETPETTTTATGSTTSTSGLPVTTSAGSSGRVILSSSLSLSSTGGSDKSLILHQQQLQHQHQHSVMSHGKVHDHYSTSQNVIPSSSSTSAIHSKFSEIRGVVDSADSGDRSNLIRRVETNGGENGLISSSCHHPDFPMMEPVMHDHAFQQQLLQLKQEQELQHQLLLQRYQAQRQQLAQAHEKQLQQRLKPSRKIFYCRVEGDGIKRSGNSDSGSSRISREFWEHKRRQDEERDRLEALKKKDKHEQSAVASSEVKQKLQGFLLNKKQREAAAAVNSGMTNGPTTQANSPPFRNWSVLQGRGGPSSGTITNCSGEIIGQDPSAAGSAFQSQPYPRRPILIAKYEDDFPLRKTASEPNLLKMRLKQRVLDRRSSPLAGRKERSSYVKRRSYLAMEGSGSAGSTPDSGPNSPPINCVVGGTPQSDDSGGAGGGSGSPHYGHSGYGPTNSPSVTDLTLYSSPSLPNISLGRPIPSQPENKLAAVSETEVRFPGVIPTNASGVPVNPVIPPFYPPPHGLDAAELEALYQSGGFMGGFLAYQAQAEAEAQSRLLAHHQQQQQQQQQGSLSGSGHQAGSVPRIIHRPLGRTQSAPLPLGHPMLVSMTPAAAAAAAAAAAVNGTNRTVMDQQQAHQLLRQHIRQTVLTRVGSRGQVVNSLSRTVSVEEDSGENDQENEHESSTSASNSNVNIPMGINHPASAIPPRLHHTVRPLSRALSSPLVALGPSSPHHQQPEVGSMHQTKPGGTGLAFDSLMLKHQCLCGDNSQHPEHPGRLQSIWARLQETGLVSMCERIRTRKATLEEIQSCHSEAHTLLFGTNPLSRQRMELSRFPESSLPIKSLVRLPCNGIGVDSDTAWNELHTPSAARMAVGCVLELALRVATGDLRNGFAIVRPPGHHAEPVQAMGFCFFNSVAIAATQLRNRLQMDKILIVDWDVHHGNGTQQIFYDDPHILYLSIHRHDEGNFFPGTGGPTECGIEDGMGFNVNIGWGGGLNPPMGDAEYLAAFRSIVMPIAQDFQPEIVLVSCGFDAAAGHPPPLGGYKLSPACFGWMTKQLMTLAHGKVVLILEGGYDLPAICDSAQECTRALLSEPVSCISEKEMKRQPCAPAVDTLLRTMAIQTPHWPVIKLYASLISCSALEGSTEGKSRDRVENETVSAMASLSMHQRSCYSMESGEQTSPNVSPAGGNGGARHRHLSSSSTMHGGTADSNQIGEDDISEETGTNEEPMDQDEPK